MYVFYRWCLCDNQLVHLSPEARVTAEQIIRNELSSVSANPGVIKPGGCAACYVLFKMKEEMQVSEQDAADLLSEVLLDNISLNEMFIAMVEEIHMKSRMMGGSFSIKTREAKDRYIDANLKNTLNEMSADASNYGAELVIRKLMLSNIALNIAQNLGIDYHAANEELYYYMRKHDAETQATLMEHVNAIVRRRAR